MAITINILGPDVIVIFLWKSTGKYSSCNIKVNWFLSRELFIGVTILDYTNIVDNFV